MNNVPTYHSTSRTVLIRETVKIEAFSSVKPENERISKHFTCPGEDLGTFELLIYPYGVTSAYETHVSVVLHTKFATEIENISHMRCNFSIIDRNGEKCHSKGKLQLISYMQRTPLRAKEIDKSEYLFLIDQIRVRS